MITFYSIKFEFAYWEIPRHSKTNALESNLPIWGVPNLQSISEGYKNNNQETANFSSACINSSIEVKNVNPNLELDTYLLDCFATNQHQQILTGSSHSSYYYSRESNFLETADLSDNVVVQDVFVNPENSVPVPSDNILEIALNSADLTSESMLIELQQNNEAQEQNWLEFDLHPINGSNSNFVAMQCSTLEEAATEIEFNNMAIRSINHYDMISDEGKLHGRNDFKMSQSDNIQHTLQLREQPRSTGLVCDV